MENQVVTKRKRNRGMKNVELEAMQGTYTALKPLSQEMRLRVIKAIECLFENDTTTGEKENANTVN